MVTLNDLSSIDKAHWELHLNACANDTAKVKKDIKAILQGGELPNIAHPSSIHDWMEIPEEREYIESWE